MPSEVHTGRLESLARTGWLHFYQMRRVTAASEMPRVICRGRGVYVWDDRGRRYLDGLSGSFCVNVGYGRSEILDAARAAAGELHYTSPFLASHPSAVELAHELSLLAAPVVGPDARVFFVNSGSEGIETALKLSRVYHRRCGHPERQGFVSRSQSYHGTTWGALAASGFEPMREEFEPLGVPFDYVPHTLCNRCELGLTPDRCALACANRLRECVTRGGEYAGRARPAAVIIEPMQNCGGNIPPPPGYLDAVSSAARDTDTLLILDEVICGFGRLGAWFGGERYGIRADILVCAKGLTSGYESLGAVIVARRVADAFLGDRDEKAFAHGSTFGGRPAATAAALANLRILKDEGLLARASLLGARLRAALRDGLADLPCVGEIRGDGLLIGLDLLDPRTNTLLDDPALLDRISEELFAAGLIARLYCMRHEPVLELAPPLIISDNDIDLIVAIVRASLLKVCRPPLVRA